MRRHVLISRGHLLSIRAHPHEAPILMRGWQRDLFLWLVEAPVGLELQGEVGSRGPDPRGRGIVSLTWASLSSNQQPQGLKTPSSPQPPFAKLTKASYFYIHVHMELESSPASLARNLGVASRTWIVLGGCRALRCHWCSGVE